LKNDENMFSFLNKNSKIDVIKKAVDEE